MIMMKLLKLLLITILISFFFVSQAHKVMATPLYSCSEPDVSAPGNISTSYNDTNDNKACDVWDYSNCMGDEYCMKWIQGSEVTCGARGLLDEAHVQGDPSIFQEYVSDSLFGEAERTIDTQTSSNFDIQKCIRERMDWYELMETSVIDRYNYKPTADINRKVSKECEALAVDQKYAPNACSVYGTNTGNQPYDSAVINILASDSKPIVVLLDINTSSLQDFPQSYLGAKPLIVRLTGFSRNSSGFSSTAQRLANMFSAKGMNASNLYFVLGNESNNPEAESFCTGVSKGDGQALALCGADYARKYAEFVSGMNTFKVAPAPLDLVNAEYPAESFMQGAIAAYSNAQVVAANIYCPSSIDAKTCIDGKEYGLSFYPQGKEVLITEFGTADVNYSGSISANTVKQQVSYIEDQCQEATNIGSRHKLVAITPLIKNCTNQVDPWLFYDNGPLRSDGLADNLNCENVKGSNASKSNNVASYDFDPDSVDNLVDFMRGNFKIRMWTPDVMVKDVYDECSQRIIPCANGTNASSELYCSNPTPVYQDGPLNTEVCQELVDLVAPSGSLLEDHMDRYYMTSDEFKQQVQAISDSKAGTRAFIIAYTDKELKKGPCFLGLFGSCYDKLDSNRLKVGTKIYPLQVIEVRIEGVYGAYKALRKMTQTLSMPDDFADFVGTVHYQGEKEFTPECPDDFIIPKEVCENLNQAYAEPGQADFYRQLIHKLAYEKNTCESGAETAMSQFTGVKSKAKPNTSISNVFRLLWDWRNDKSVPTEDIPTTTTWVLSDEATGYVAEYIKKQAFMLTMPDTNMAAKERDVLFDHSLGAIQDGSTDQVSRLRRVSCSDPNDEECIDGYKYEKETAQVTFESSSDKSDTYLTRGGNSAQFWCSYYHGLTKMPDDSAVLKGCDTFSSSYYDLLACIAPAIPSKLGVNPNSSACQNYQLGLENDRSGQEIKTCSTAPKPGNQFSSLPSSIQSIITGAAAYTGVPANIIAGIASVEGSTMWRLSEAEILELSKPWKGSPLSNASQATLDKIHCNPNSAGAIGPMQFLSSTFEPRANTAKEALGDGRTPSICNITDAIYAAAQYLKEATSSKSNSDWTNPEKICLAGKAYYGSCKMDNGTCSFLGNTYCDYLLSYVGGQELGGSQCQKLGL